MFQKRRGLLNAGANKLSHNFRFRSDTSGCAVQDLLVLSTSARLASRTPFTIAYL